MPRCQVHRATAVPRPPRIQFLRTATPARNPPIASLMPVPSVETEVVHAKEKFTGLVDDPHSKAEPA